MSRLLEAQELSADDLEKVTGGWEWPSWLGGDRELPYVDGSGPDGCGQGGVPSTHRNGMWACWYPDYWGPVPAGWNDPVDDGG
jgi:hypothetical protein